MRILLKILIFITILFSFHQPAESKRIVSLAPSLTAAVNLLGSSKELVGYTAFCIIPQGKDPNKIIATAVDVNIEKVMALNPDIIIATSLSNAKTIARLKSYNLPIKVFTEPRNFQELCQQFIDLGIILDKETLAREIVAECNRKKDKITAANISKIKPKVFIQIGARPLFTVTKDSFINNIIELAGGINIAKEAKSGLYSPEEVLNKNPDYILIALMGIDTKATDSFWQNFNHIAAVKNGNIYNIDSYKICSPTPVTFIETLQEISNIFNAKGNNAR